MGKRKKLQLAMHGASGRMGQEILKLLKEDKDSAWVPAVGVSRSYGDTGYERSLPDFQSLGKAPFANLVVDFSSPQGLRILIKELHNHRTPLLSGTTGLTQADFDLLKKLARKVPVFWSPNTSIGVAVLRRAMKALSSIRNFDFSIDETHHIHKKDAPSGTAKILHSDLEKIVGKKIKAPVSIRGGGVVGHHRILALGPEEQLSLQHEAFSRRVFARGALEIGTWIIQQKPGFYEMDDFLDSQGIKR